MREPPTLTLFFFNDTATTEIYTLSLHDALPIWRTARRLLGGECNRAQEKTANHNSDREPVAHMFSSYKNGKQDRKSTRLNSSHANISYAVFCLKKKKQ